SRVPSHSVAAEQHSLPHKTVRLGREGSPEYWTAFSTLVSSQTSPSRAQRVDLQHVRVIARGVLRQVDGQAFRGTRKHEIWFRSHQSDSGDFAAVLRGTGG